MVFEINVIEYSSFATIIASTSEIFTVLSSDFNNPIDPSMQNGLLSDIPTPSISSGEF